MKFASRLNRLERQLSRALARGDHPDIVFRTPAFVALAASAVSARCARVGPQAATLGQARLNGSAPNRLCLIQSHGTRARSGKSSGSSTESQPISATSRSRRGGNGFTTTVLPLDNSPVQFASDRQARSSPLWFDFDPDDSFFTDSRRKSCNKTACAGK